MNRWRPSHQIEGVEAPIADQESTAKANKRMMFGGVACLLLVSLIAGIFTIVSKKGNDDITTSGSSVQMSELSGTITDPSQSPSSGPSLRPIQNPTSNPSTSPTKAPVLPPGWEDDVMPNIGFLLRGYDLMKGNPTPTSSDGVAKTDPGFQLPIFDATYSALKKTPDLRYNIPDNVEAVSCSGGCNLNFVSETIESSQEYIDRLSTKVRYHASAAIKIFQASFSASVDYEQLSERINEQSQIATASEASCCVYEAELSAFATPAFHPTFLGALAALPEQYDVAIYRKFVREYGTHYVKKATMGALYGQQSFLTWEKRFELERQKIDVNVAAEASVLSLAQGGWSVDTGISSEAVKQFESSREQESLYTRGALPPPDGNINTWFESVGRDPAPISLEVERIDSLDLPVSNEVRANLEGYLNSYCEDLVAEEVIGDCEVPEKPGRPPTPVPTPSPTPSPTATPRMTLMDIKMKVGDHWGLSSYENTKPIIKVGGKTYYPYGNTWKHIFQGSWYEFGSFEVPDLLPGLLELRIQIHGHGSDYVWYLQPEDWFKEQNDYETPGKDTNNNRNYLKWKFDVVKDN